MDLTGLKKFTDAVQEIPVALEFLTIVFALGFVSTVVALVFLASRVHRLIDVLEKNRQPPQYTSGTFPPPGPNPQQQYLTPFPHQRPPQP